MHVLIIKNVDAEGPGTIEEYLRQEAIAFSIVDLHKGQETPALDAFTHLVVMGGPMAVYEMDLHPFLKREAKIIEQAISAGRSVLGICLGAQMIAHVLGARVYAGGAREIGWYRVALTAGGMKDRLMAGLAVDGANSAEVFQWHGDTFDLPNRSLLLASSALFPNQAFRHQDKVYALQFHIEVTPAIVLDWLSNEKGVDLNRVTGDSNRIYDAYRARAMSFYRGFFKD
jgi:GMP synthase (glutamine-hydrolysing)